MVIGSDTTIGGGRPEMEPTISAFSANETALDPNSACYCADKYHDAVSPEFDLNEGLQHRLRLKANTSLT